MAGAFPGGTRPRKCKAVNQSGEQSDPAWSGKLGGGGSGNSPSASVLQMLPRLGTATRMQLKETETDEQEVGVPAGAGAVRDVAVCAQLQTQLLHATQELL